MAKKEVIALIGDLNWKEMRSILIKQLLLCENEIDFLEFMEMIINSAGTKKQLEKQRKEMNIKDFSEKDKKLMEKFKL